MVASYDLQPGNGAGPIFWKVRDRRRNRTEGKTHKKGRRKTTNRKGKQNKIQISHSHTAPKSTSESQAQITHLLTAPEPAWGPNSCVIPHPVRSNFRKERTQQQPKATASFFSFITKRHHNVNRIHNHTFLCST